MLCDFVVMLHAHEMKKENEWRHTRAILGALTGKDPRFIVPLTGDFDELKNLKSVEHLRQIFRADKIWKDG